MKPRLEKLALAGSVPVIITNSFLNKMKFLCKNINKVEWSGVLFYTVRGSIKQPDTLKVTLQDIFLMDKGTAGSTEFDWDEDVVGYRIDNPKAMDWLIGHIHSHNTMDVFFSEKDWTELNNNSPLHNYYLSVIVNNYMDLKGKIAFVGEYIIPANSIREYTCKDETGKDFKFPIELEEPEQHVVKMILYDCNFIKPKEEIIVSDSFIDRLKHIEKSAYQRQKEEEEERNKKKEEDKRKGNMAYMEGNRGGGYMGDWGNHKWDYNNSNKALPNSTTFPQTEVKLTIEEKFLCYILRLSVAREGDTINNVMKDIKYTSSEAIWYVDAIIRNYITSYDSFFEKEVGFGLPAHFEDVTEAIIEMVKGQAKTYPQLEPLSTKLAQLALDTQAALLTEIGNNTK